MAAADADPKGRAGQSAAPESEHLATVAGRAAADGERDPVTVSGTAYDTKDSAGGCDYIHVSDLADAAEGGGCRALNRGYGRGFSACEGLETVVTGRKDLDVREGPWRAGGPPAPTADVSHVLGGWCAPP